MLRIIPRFILERPALALFSLLATASSGFGQTYFVGVFGDSFRQQFGLTHSAYGLCYSAATLCAAGLLIRFGPLVDRWQLGHVTMAAVLVLSAGCALLASALSLPMFVVGLLLIRFGGQAMLSHIGISSAGRHFTAARGRAMALTAAGFPITEAFLPALAVTILGSYGWRIPWFGSAVILILILLPILLRLSRDAPDPRAVSPSRASQTPGKTRAEALRDLGFYWLMPATIAVPFTSTALLFHQSAIAQMNGWPPGLFAKAFIGFAAGHLLSLFGVGVVIDRFGAQRVLPFTLAPMAVGLLLIGFAQAPATPFLALALLGLSQGASNATVGAIWPERYGIEHIGAIRSVVQAVMVVASAVSPILVGVLLDIDISVELLMAVLALLAVGASLLAKCVAVR